ncbi:sulfatase-like hydrolase/transferase [Helicobacter bizzozeronii]|uniref:sulfatase-like hydrolase/transferase n=1 Tax=Helicobacter bizzozeronii TaxID=56877 RepID=UPI000CF059A1|nr:sulfatase-like hydrolase/transferase [Helicobacter bizzozeronii]
MGRVVLDSRFLLCWLAFVLASIYQPDAHLSYLPKTLIRTGFYTAMFFYIIYTIVGFLPALWAHRLKNIITLLSLCIAFVRFFVGYFFNMDINQALIETLLGTNSQETHSFLVAHVFSHSLLIVGIIAVCSVLWFMRLKWHLSSKIHLLFLGVFILGTGAHMIRTAYLFHQRGFIGFEPPEIWDTLPFTKEARAIYFSFKQDARLVRASLDKPYPKDYLKVDSDSVDNVVLVIGESASKNFMGVYGYPVPNTPFLSGLAERERERDRKICLCSEMSSLPKPALMPPLKLCSITAT